jgi:hypothetical protein
MGERRANRQRIGNQIDAAMIFARADFVNVFGHAHGLVVKGKRISCPPQYGHRDPQGVLRRLGESHCFDHGFPLIRSLRASVQRSTSELFSFVLPFDCGGIIHRPAIKNDSGAIPQPTEWQRIGNQIDATMIFARADFIFMHRKMHSGWLPAPS